MFLPDPGGVSSLTLTALAGAMLRGLGAVLLELPRLMFLSGMLVAPLYIAILAIVLITSHWVPEWYVSLAMMALIGLGLCMWAGSVTMVVVDALKRRDSESAEIILAMFDGTFPRVVLGGMAMASLSLWLV